MKPYNILSRETQASTESNWHINSLQQRIELSGSRNEISATQFEYQQRRKTESLKTRRSQLNGGPLPGD